MVNLFLWGQHNEMSTLSQDSQIYDGPSLIKHLQTCQHTKQEPTGSFACDSIILMTITLQPPYKGHPFRLTFSPKSGVVFRAKSLCDYFWWASWNAQKKKLMDRDSLHCAMVMVSTLLCPQQALWGLVDKTWQQSRDDKVLWGEKNT